MFFCCLGVHQDIIIVDDHKLVQLFMEDKVHKGGEHRRNIAQPKWHHQKLIQAIPSPHCHLFHIFTHDVDLIVPQFEINLVKVFCPIESIQKIINVGHRIIILYGYFIEIMVINTHLQLAILFIIKQNWGLIR